MQKLLGMLTNIIPFRSLKSISRQSNLLPFYHLISDNPVPHVKHLYSIKTVAEFLKDLEFFLKFYKPIGLPDLLHSYSSGNSVQKKIFLSFDDGLSECYHVVAPILKKKGIPATFFLNSGFIDNQDLFYRYKASLLIEELHTKPVTIHLQKKNWRHINYFKNKN